MTQDDLDTLKQMLLLKLRKDEDAALDFIIQSIDDATQATMYETLRSDIVNEFTAEKAAIDDKIATLKEISQQASPPVQVK